MNFFKLCFVSSAVLACVVSQAGQDNGVSVKKWQAYYDMGAQMFDKMDAKGITSSLTTDWKSYGPMKLAENGNDPKKLVQSFAGVKSINVQFKVLSVKGDRHKVTVHASFMYSVAVKPGPDKKSHMVIQKGISNDDWVLKNGKWLMAVNRTVQQSDTMDGKPMPARGG